MVTTSEIVYCLIHELLVPLNLLVSVCSVLEGEGPAIVSEQIGRIGEAAHHLASQVVELRQHLEKRLDLGSPVKTAEQIRELASGWKGYEAVLSDSIGQIQASGAEMEDSELNRVLNKSLPEGLRRLKHLISLLEAIQPKHLMPYEGPFRMPEI